MRAPCVVEEQLVEVPHAVQQEGVRVLGLDAQVLLHHGRVPTQTGLRWCHRWDLRFSIAHSSAGVAKDRMATGYGAVGNMSGAVIE